jgi:hypothetical protein
MSHANFYPSQQADQRISWQSIPESDLNDDSSVSEIEPHRGQSLSLLSAVSRTQSRDVGDGAPESSEEGRTSQIDAHHGQSLSSLSLDFRHGISHNVSKTNDNSQRSEGDDSLRHSVQNAIGTASAASTTRQSCEEARSSKAQNPSSEFKTGQDLFLSSSLVLITVRLSPNQNTRMRLVSLHATSPLSDIPRIDLPGSCGYPTSSFLVFSNPSRAWQR